MSPRNPKSSAAQQADPATGPRAGKPADEQWLDVVAAASLLSMSRAYVEKLVEDGLLGEVRRTDDGPVFVLDSAVASYKARLKQAQKRGLAQMVAASKRAGLYAREDEAVAQLRREGTSTPGKRT